MNIRKIDESVDGKVTAKGKYKIKISGIIYDIVSPTEPLYPDHSYIEWDGALWVAE